MHPENGNRYPILDIHRRMSIRDTPAFMIYDQRRRRQSKLGVFDTGWASDHLHLVESSLIAIPDVVEVLERSRKGPQAHRGEQIAEAARVCTILGRQ